MPPYHINNDLVKKATKSGGMSDMTITVEEDGSRRATVASPGGNLPSVFNGERIQLKAAGPNNQGVWQVDDPAPSTSAFVAVKIGGNVPETDASVPNGVKIWHGGQIHERDGSNINPNASEIAFEDVELMDLSHHEVDGDDPGGPDF